MDITCPNCRTNNIEGAKFCDVCGEELKIKRGKTLKKRRKSDNSYVGVIGITIFIIIAFLVWKILSFL